MITVHFWNRYFCKENDTVLFYFLNVFFQHIKSLDSRRKNLLCTGYSNPSSCRHTIWSIIFLLKNYHYIINFSYRISQILLVDIWKMPKFVTFSTPKPYQTDWWRLTGPPLRVGNAGICQNFTVFGASQFTLTFYCKILFNN